ncbi:MAG: C69 family dipeptidase [Planctomycetaceae bacterium]|jgi:dipeptidase|nr:C69 family dipeptidase [Planctomycetaceae bacterium]
MKTLPLTILFPAAFLFAVPAAFACTNVLVTKGASADGSVMITYTADSAGSCPRLTIFPAAEYPADAVIDVPELKDKEGKIIRAAGKIKQVAKTFQVIGTTEGDSGSDTSGWKMGCINEHQVAMAETTFGGKEELHNPAGLVNYPMLITLALQRAKTAREAIDVMIGLAEEYGYNDEGESISVADKNEAWVFEIVGTGKSIATGNGSQNGKQARGGAVWVARKVPDGEISVHANQARIGEIPEKPNRDECFYSGNIRSFAAEKGWYDPKSGQEFRFDEMYDEITPKSKRVCASRVWSVLRRAAPSQNFSPDYHRGIAGAKRYPWSIKPDKKLTTRDVIALKRDHFEGTEFDMTQGIDAGEYGLPRRWRPLYWKLEEDKDNENAQEYSWERPISTQQTGFSMVTQSRANLPDAVGGVMWYGVDDNYLSCYFPVYCGITDVPKSFTIGTIKEFSWDSAWWIFNLTANYANLKYARIAPEIIAVQKELEDKFFSLQKSVEQTAAALLQTDAEQAKRYLTDYTVTQGEMVTARWKQLAVHIFTKFNDGYIRGTDGKYPKEGDPYPDPWLRRVLKEKPEQFKLPKPDTGK